MQLITKHWSNDYLYKHENNTDVAMFVIDAVKKFSGWKLHILWYNIGKCHSPYSMNIKESVFIKNEDIQKWLKISYK